MLRMFALCDAITLRKDLLNVSHAYPHGEDSPSFLHLLFAFDVLQLTEIERYCLSPFFLQLAFMFIDYNRLDAASRCQVECVYSLDCCLLRDVGGVHSLIDDHSGAVCTSDASYCVCIRCPVTCLVVVMHPYVSVLVLDVYVMSCCHLGTIFIYLVDLMHYFVHLLQEGLTGAVRIAPSPFHPFAKVDFRFHVAAVVNNNVLLCIRDINS